MLVIEDQSPQENVKEIYEKSATDQYIQQHGQGTSGDVITEQHQVVGTYQKPGQIYETTDQKANSQTYPDATLDSSIKPTQHEEPWQIDYWCSPETALLDQTFTCTTSITTAPSISYTSTSPRNCQNISRLSANASPNHICANHFTYHPSHNFHLCLYEDVGCHRYKVKLDVDGPRTYAYNEWDYACKNMDQLEIFQYPSLWGALITVDYGSFAVLEAGVACNIGNIPMLI